MLERLKSLMQAELLPENGASDSGVADRQYFVARQPVFDARGAIWGYELLYRRPQNLQAAAIDSGIVATASVIINGFETVRPSLKTTQKALINFPGTLLETQVATLLPAESCVVEILETVLPTPQVLESLAAIKKAGYAIAVDDYMGQEHLQAFLPFAAIIKVDVLSLSSQELAAQILQLRTEGYSGMLLAEKVEDAHMADLCREAGFHLFQGYFFSKPQIICGKKVSTSQAVRMHILALCVAEDVDMKALSSAVLHDPVITARFLKFVNSPHFGLCRPIRSVHHALTLVGPVCEAARKMRMSRTELENGQVHFLSTGTGIA